MELSILEKVIEGLAAYGPAFTILAYGWYMESKRSAMYLAAWRASDRRVRAVLREAANLEPEPIPNGIKP
ncbi:unnamed protein product [marine sediment metagenome]|uniref:Uncharacterized protein n=1 Tax=marine sediment metagenome TaxID=412755 RepID=X1UTN4_9ZZZZ